VKPQVRAANFRPVFGAPAPVPQAALTAAVPNTAAKTCCCTTTSCCPACAGLECLDRTRFFSGQLLTEADLNNEQSYVLAKNRLHNRYLFGSGVVCGLQVTCSECEGWVNINPGYAIDPCGNDIIVCAAQSFNVLQAIQACCAPQPATDCSPLRYRPVANCQDAIQTWCVTIEYQEQQSQMVTPLQPMTSGGCSCGCSNSNGCSCGSAKSKGCGCGNGSSISRSGSSSTAGSAAAACEATRILEGYQLGICKVPSASTQFQQQPGTQAGVFTQNVNPGISAYQTLQPGTFEYQFFQCYQALYALLLQRPTLKDANGNFLSDAQAYQATCQYLKSVQNAFAATFITHCNIESALNAIQIPAPPSQSDPQYVQGLEQKIKIIAEIILAAVLDCLCSSLLPPCPGAVCDNRLILACVTVQNGKITNICHFGGGRKQVVTFPALFYWLSIFGFDKAVTALGHFLELLCCGEEEQRRTVFNGDYNSRAVFVSGSSGNPATMNHAMASFIAEKLGAAVVNTASDTAKAVDLRPIVGLETARAQRLLESYGLKTGGAGFIQKDVSADPAWTDEAVAAGAAYAPAAFDVTKPLTMFTKGSMVVGFDITSPTDVLSAQIADLQQQVNNLTSQFSATKQGPGTAGPGSTPKKPGA
jgi:hypothetical protein